MVTGSALWTISDHRSRDLGLEMLLLLLAIIIFAYAAMMLVWIGHNVGLRNRVQGEMDLSGFMGVQMATTEETRTHGLIVRLRWLANNPWDLGAWENWCAMMGRPAVWLF